MSAQLDLTDIETFIEAAEKHGEDEHPDHEIGDLQAMLNEVWELLPAMQRATVLESDPFKAVLEAGSVKDGADLEDIETFVEAARQHGENDEPENETGDLQDMLREAWEALPATERAAALESEAFINTIEAAHPGAMGDSDDDDDDLDPDM